MLENTTDTDFIVIDCNSTTKDLTNYPWILTYGYDYEKKSLGNEGNRAKCKFCTDWGAWRTDDRTSNLRRHILEYFPTKHAAAKAKLLKHQNISPSTNFFMYKDVLKIIQF